MYPIFGVPPHFDKLVAQNKLLIEKFFASDQIKGRKILISAQGTLYTNTGTRGMVYVIKDGILSHSQSGRVLYFYDTGDLVGYQQDDPSLDCRIFADFAVSAEEYSLSDIYKSLQDEGQAELWRKIIANYYELLNIIIFISAETKLEVHPETITIQEGEVITEQGSYGTDVFTLVEGHLDVLVDGISVGEVMPDEIFGAMAALTETARSATVVATELSVLLKLPRDRFLDLMKSRPLTVMKMIEDMSRTIVSLNERVVELSKITT
jgi:CRP-like cAMP-binding protein